MTQGEALWPHLTVAENVALPPGRPGRSRGGDRRRQVDEALATVGVEALADRRPGELDALQRRRVELARAIVAEPAVLILDEPAGPLDHRDRPALLRRPPAVRSSSDRTVLVLTHASETTPWPWPIGSPSSTSGGSCRSGRRSRSTRRRPTPSSRSCSGRRTCLQGQVVGADAAGRGLRPDDDRSARRPDGRRRRRPADRHAGDHRHPSRGDPARPEPAGRREPLHGDRRAPGLPRRPADRSVPGARRLAALGRRRCSPDRPRSARGSR